MRARIRPWIILIALATLVVLGAVFFPASWALTVLRPETSELRYTAISGLWWQGEADGVVWRGLHLGNARWQLTDLVLDGGVRSHWDVSGNGPDYELTARLELHGGRLRAARAVRGMIPANWLAPPETALFAGLGGRLDLDIDRIRLDGEGRPVAARGTVRWRDAGLTGLLRSDLGEVGIRFEEQDHMTVMDITPRPGDSVRLSGRGWLANGGYRGQLRFDSADPEHELLRQLEKAGERQADGSLLLPFAGTFGDHSP